MKLKIRAISDFRAKMLQPPLKNDFRYIYVPKSCKLCPRIFYSERNLILHVYAHTLDDTICFESRDAISCTSGVTRVV